MLLEQRKAASQQTRVEKDTWPNQVGSIDKKSPIPVMPSGLFQNLALSQLEFLATALESEQRPGSSKVKSAILYVPQENVLTGQLEFTPGVLYPSRDRVFIASDADSGVAPTLPATLTKLPGFSHAKALIPGYPMVSTNEDGSISDGSVGIVEEVLCDLQSRGACALSVPLFSGLQTLGVLLVSPSDVPKKLGESVWTKSDRQQVSRAARSLSIALSMDQENQAMVDQNAEIARALSDSMHQIKNPLQALRTYGKLLQRQIAYDEGDVDTHGSVQGSVPSQRRLLELADHLMIQSDRLSQRLTPMDSMVDRLTSSKRPSLLLPSMVENISTSSSSLAQWPTPLVPWEENQENRMGANDQHSNPRPNYKSRDNWKNGVREKGDSLPTSSSEAESKSELELEMAFVSDVLGPIFSTFLAIAEDQRVAFAVQDDSDELPGVHVHPGSLQEVVSNILDNAFKYVVLGKAKIPEVRVCLLPNELAQYYDTKEDEEQARAGVTILVTDNGPGISKVASQNIFERGFRIASTKEQAKGQGLGLAIAQTLVHAMDGQLRVIDSDDARKRSHLSRNANFELLSGATMEIILFRKG